MPQETMAEVWDLIAFYDARGWDWRSAAEFTLGGKSAHWTKDYILIPKRGRWTEEQKQTARDRYRARTGRG